MRTNKKSNLKYFFSIILLIIIDQFTKYIVATNMELGQSIEIIKGIFSFTYIHNSGAAFGMMQGKSVILLLFPILLIIFFYYNLIKSEKLLSKISLSLIISGAIGNLIDRIRYGYVVDMIDFYSIWRYIFNVADMYVVVGSFLLMIKILMDKE